MSNQEPPMIENDLSQLQSQLEKEEAANADAAEADAAKADAVEADAVEADAVEADVVEAETDAADVDNDGDVPAALPELLPPSEQAAMQDPAMQDPAMQDPMAQQQMVDDEIEARINELIDDLEEEYGEDAVTEILVEVAYNPQTAPFFLEAQDALREVVETKGSKVPFILHTEANNGDRYILRGFGPSEFNTKWVYILTGDRDAFVKYADTILKTCMVYPSFEETDWDWTGDKINTPRGLTKQRLVGSVLDQEVDMTENDDVVFGQEDLENATKAAKKNTGKAGF